ncbi:MAG: hypothetical protein GXP29_13625, partial [Planctomycetes bacterium]|nr:hypothetical protein [Planctomycetota bacterium]
MTKHTLLLHRRTIAAVLGACILASTASANAQLREKLPQDSIVFVEFAGSERTHKACLTTPFGQMMNDPGMKSLTKTVWSAIKKKIAEEGAKNSEAELAANAQDLLLHLWKKGFALNLSNIQMGQQGPDVSLVFATPVGLHSKKFVDSFEFLLRSEQKLRPEPVKVEGHNLTRFTAPTPVPVVMHYGVIDGTFVFMIGNNTPTQVIASMTGSAPNLASNKSLQKALETIGTKNRTLLGAIHIDVATILDQGEELFKAMGQEGFPPMVKSILDEFGINGCRSLTLISQIADGGYRSSMFLATAPERKGLFKIADQLPLSDDDLSWIPREATMAAATNFDVAKAYDDLMATLDAVPMMAGPTKMAVGEFEKVAGMNLRKDILSTFKDGYFIFDAPTTGGLFFTGMT